MHLGVQLFDLLSDIGYCGGWAASCWACLGAYRNYLCWSTFMQCNTSTTEPRYMLPLCSVSCNVFNSFCSNYFSNSSTVFVRSSCVSDAQKYFVLTETPATGPFADCTGAAGRTVVHALALIIVMAACLILA